MAHALAKQFYDIRADGNRVGSILKTESFHRVTIKIHILQLSARREHKTVHKST
jgi:hypothetical protein